MRRHHLVPAMVVLLLASPAAHACLWDYDTLLMERRRFPGALELIVGKFLRHSPEFYEWRIRDRTEKLKSEPDRLEYYDDLAVAHHKLGRHKEAIEIIQKKDRLRPGLYETEANWGTFLLFDGRWEESLPHIHKALEINPDAHFGREKYQALLIEYVIPRLNNGKPQLPLFDVAFSTRIDEPDGSVRYTETKTSFALFLAFKQGDAFQRTEAVNAVLGMMRFADHRSPILLEALASLLVDKYEDELGQRLAARAYLMAASAVEDPKVREKYREAAEFALHTQHEVKLDNVERELQRELHEAAAWYAKLKETEQASIRDGKDPEAEFARQYPDEPELTIRAEIDPPKDDLRQWLTFVGVALAVAAAISVAVVLLRRRRNAKLASPSAGEALGA